MLVRRYPLSVSRAIIPSGSGKTSRFQVKTR